MDTATVFATSATTVEAVLAQARIAVEEGEDAFRRAAEYIAQASAMGVPQRRIAAATGLNLSSVSMLLRWRREGYQGRPFARNKRKHEYVRPVEHLIPICPKERRLLIGALGRLGSEHPAEQVTAANKAEEIRRRLGLTWAQLIVVVVPLDEHPTKFTDSQTSITACWPS